MITTIIIALFAGAVFLAQGKNGFVLNGNVSGLKNGRQVYLVSHNFKTNKLDTISKAVSLEGKFSLKGVVAYPQVCYLSVQGVHDELTVFVENTVMFVSGKIEALNDMSITGSRTQDELNTYSRQHAEVMSKKLLLAAEYQKAKETGDEVKVAETFKELEVMNAKAKSAAHTFASKNPKSYASALILLKNFNDKDLAETSAIYHKFSNDVRQSSAALAIKKRLDILAKTGEGKLRV